MKYLNDEASRLRSISETIVIDAEAYAILQRWAEEENMTVEGMWTEREDGQFVLRGVGTSDRERESLEKLHRMTATLNTDYSGAIKIVDQLSNVGPRKASDPNAEIPIVNMLDETKM